MSDERPARGETVRWNGGVWKVETLGEGLVGLRNAVSGKCETLTLAQWLGGISSDLIERRARPPAFGGGTLRAGRLIRWKDATWRVTVVRGGIINLQNAATGESGSIPAADWQQACFDGLAGVAPAPGAEPDERTREVLSVAITSMTPSMRAGADRVALFIEAWRDPDAFHARHLPDTPEDERITPGGMSKAPVEAFLGLVATAHGTAPPSFTTFWRWLRRYEKAGNDLRGAVPRHDRKGPHARYMNPRVEEWLSRAIDRFWLRIRKNKKAKVHEELSETVTAWNAANPERPLAAPSKSHVCRYIRDEVDRHVAMARRGSKAEADRAFRQTGRAAGASTILERVEVDHSFVNMRLKDDRTGVILGNPWITAALDNYSRMPLAMHVSFENQSLGANFQCLRQVMSPKGFLRKLVPGIDYPFPAGVPTGFYFDRGRDYDNDHIRRIGLSLEVTIDYEPVACPEYKGTLERWWRTLKEDVVYGLPGAKLPGGRQVAGVDEDGEAFITYSEFVRRAWLWISMDYAKSYHRGINDVPLLWWREAASVTDTRALRKKDDLNVLLTRVERCAVSVTGVTWNSLTWNGPPLADIMRHPGYRDAMRVDVRVDEYDVSNAWVINPFSLRDEALRPAMKDYMTGLSVHAHDRILKNARKPAMGTLDQRSLEKAKKGMRDQEAALMDGARARRNGAVSSQVAKFAGIGQKAPFGADLAGVLPDPDGLDDPPAGAGDEPQDDAPPAEDVAPPAPRAAPPPRPRPAVRRVRNDD